MGEEEKKDVNPKEEEDKKKIEEEVPEEVVLKVDMHCGACARKVARSLRGFQGVKEVMTECKASKVVVKGKELDAAKLSERIQKKTGRKVDIISMLPKPPEPKPKPEPEPEPEKKQQPEQSKEEKKDEPPPVITIALKMSMHCDACAQRLQKRILKIKGVESVKTELANEQVVVTGMLAPEKLMNDVIKKTRKQASIIVKEEEKKEEKKEAEKEEEAPDAKKADDINIETKKNESSPPKNYMDYYSYAPEMFSDENPHACLVM
ncbi:heavy metal-associated isoprenylated plant protein 7-like [Bidens hawaiensis]|uniref:heavy metal-associated isoprenylated plant protein 7-like n=1 Tax=Bidens hawaiensis TaxID=980011 RepID=UPI004049B37A